MYESFPELRGIEILMATADVGDWHKSLMQGVGSYVCSNAPLFGLTVVAMGGRDPIYWFDGARSPRKTRKENVAGNIFA